MLVVIILFATRTGYDAVSQALEQNYQDNNTTVNKKLPPLLSKQKRLASELTTAKHDRIITNYHYKQVFSKVDSKDKTLRKWINKKQTVEDRISTLKSDISANDKQVNHYQNAYISRANVKNATFNLKSIAIVLACILIFFAISF
ncbi:hypothetical protein [Lactobacillus sp. Sy-1]|uniref:hypothetical protein n=1 Tax=Lactobacillus sp. Sy-1 TaxID=2109645 RepID=UPI001C5BB6CB|nr:hypothetical protein [Lactobacillus sp. Sy-1]MBW1606230.1 hypothetical protein [Lactobacillus sp. Sy-1]